MCADRKVAGTKFRYSDQCVQKLMTLLASGMRNKQFVHL